MTREMSRPTVRERVDAALDRAAATLTGDELAGAARGLAAHRERWASRMRVALVGRVSAGKSTLANALLGEDVLGTGWQELTYNVNWLRYAPAPELEIHYKDGTAERADSPTFQSLAELTARRQAAEQGYLDGIDFLLFGYPNERLDSFDLVDTPGLDSTFGADTANTMRYLGLDEAGARAASDAHAAQADALVLVFAKGVQAEERQMLRRFQRGGAAPAGEVNPLTTIGVLTKVEEYWPGTPDVMKAGRDVARTLMRDANMRQVLYELHPVASKLAAAAAGLTAEELADLTELARPANIEPCALAEWVRIADWFAMQDRPGVAVPAARREALINRFTAYGIVTACDLIRDEKTRPDDPAELRRLLLDGSGLTAFRQRLTEHLGERADLIKLERLIKGARALKARHRAKLDFVHRDLLNRAAGEVIDLELSVREFAERAVLRRSLEGDLELDQAETEEMFRVFGEEPRVRSLPGRLGLPATAPAAQLAAQARERRSYWHAKAHVTSGPTRQACRVLRGCYEDVLDAIGGHAR